MYNIYIYIYLYMYIYILIWIYFICILLYNHICQLWRFSYRALDLYLWLYTILTGPFWVNRWSMVDNSCNIFDAYRLSHLRMHSIKYPPWNKHSLWKSMVGRFPETSIVYENQWLEDEICIWDGQKNRGQKLLSFRECVHSVWETQLRPEEQDAYLEAQDTENLFGSLLIFTYTYMHWLIGWLIHTDSLSTWGTWICCQCNIYIYMLPQKYVRTTSTDTQTNRQANKPKQKTDKQTIELYLVLILHHCLRWEWQWQKCIIEPTICIWTCICVYVLRR